MHKRGITRQVTKPVHPGPEVVFLKMTLPFWDGPFFKCLQEHAGADFRKDPTKVGHLSNLLWFQGIDMLLLVDPRGQQFRRLQGLEVKG